MSPSDIPAISTYISTCINISSLERIEVEDGYQISKLKYMRERVDIENVFVKKKKMKM